MRMCSDRALSLSGVLALPTKVVGVAWIAVTSTGLALAQGYPAEGQAEMGRVLSSIPMVQQVAVPRQVCSDAPVVVPGQTSGGGAIMGGIAGGAIGNQIGKGSGRAAATAIGIIGGALLGNRIEGDNRPSHTEMMRQCSTQTVYENQTVGYTVTYEYAGRQYTTQMSQDPGAWVRLQVTPVGNSYPSNYPNSYPSGAVTYPVAPPPNGVYSPAVVNRPYNPQISLEISSSRWDRPAPPPRHHHWDDHRYREWR